MGSSLFISCPRGKNLANCSYRNQCYTIVSISTITAHKMYLYRALSLSIHSMYIEDVVNTHTYITVYIYIQHIRDPPSETHNMCRLKFSSLKSDSTHVLQKRFQLEHHQRKTMISFHVSILNPELIMTD